MTANAAAEPLQSDAHIVERSARLASAARIEAAAKTKPAASRTDETLRKARQTIGRMHSSSHCKIDAPTPERLAQAGKGLVLGSAVRSVEIVKDGEARVEQIRVPRARVDQDPFTRMVQRGQLDTESEDMNRWMGEAGERYRRLHQAAGRSGLQGQDPTKGFTTANRGPSSTLDRMLDNWGKWDAAQQCIPMAMRRTVDEILLEGKKPEDAHLPAGSYTKPKYRMVIAMSLLRIALQDLDRHFAQVDAES